MLGLCAGLALAEVLVRVVYPELPDTSWESRLFCRDSTLNVRMMKPNVSGFASAEEFNSVKATSNSKGYRDTEWSSKKGAKHRVMVLGDSFTWGWGVSRDSIITTVLDDSDPDLAVYNLGIPGDDLQKLYSRFIYHANKIKPTHILIINYINDFLDIDMQSRNLGSMREKGLLDPKGEVSLSCGYEYKDRLKSTLNLSYLFRLANRFRFRFLLKTRKERSDLLVKELKRESYRVELVKISDTGWFRDVAEFYRPMLKDIVSKVRVTILYIPPFYQSDSAQNVQIRGLLPGIDFHPDAANRGLSRLSSEIKGVNFLDLTADMYAEQSKRNLYFKTDGHLNTAGQRFVGQWLVGRLEYK